MFGKIISFGDLRAYLDKTISTYRVLETRYEEARQLDSKSGGTFHHQQYFLSWHGVALISTSTAAHHAYALKQQLAAYSDDEPLTDHIKRGVLNHLLRSDVGIDSRASLLSTNLSADAESKFWLELMRHIEGK